MFILNQTGKQKCLTHHFTQISRKKALGFDL
jgi:hypothetical protein